MSLFLFVSVSAFVIFFTPRVPIIFICRFFVSLSSLCQLFLKKRFPSFEFYKFVCKFRLFLERFTILRRIFLVLSLVTFVLVLVTLMLVFMLFLLFLVIVFPFRCRFFVLNTSWVTANLAKNKKKSFRNKGLAFLQRQPIIATYLSDDSSSSSSLLDSLFLSLLKPSTSAAILVCKHAVCHAFASTWRC